MRAGSLDERAIAQLAKQLGADADDAVTQQAIKIGVPMLLDALNKNTQSQNGAQSLLKTLVKEHNGSILDGDTTEDFMSLGGSLLSSFFGRKR